MRPTLRQIAEETGLSKYFFAVAKFLAAVPKVAIGLFASCENPKPVTFRWLLYE